jgi:Icc-related predicted phosphoesterase
VRLLLVSDLHYTLAQFDWVVARASDFDVVVMAGDQLDISSTVPLDAQTVVMLQYFELLQSTSRFIVSSGNHDLTGEDANGERAAVWLGHARRRGIPTDGDAVLVGDTLITVCPWWDGPIGRDTVAAQLTRDAADRPERWIWVYHWPPLGSPTSWTGKRSYGDDELGAWIDEHRPDVVLCGHVHQPPFKPDGGWADRIGGTWVFNAGRQTGSTPTCIEIDFDAQLATWSSLMGSEEIDLTVATTPPRTLF